MRKKCQRRIAIRNIGEDANGPRYEHKGGPVRLVWSMGLFCHEEPADYIFARVTGMEESLRAGQSKLSPW